jgi:hypothetical protein
MGNRYNDRPKQSRNQLGRVAKAAARQTLGLPNDEGPIRNVPQRRKMGIRLIRTVPALPGSVVQRRRRRLHRGRFRGRQLLTKRCPLLYFPAAEQLDR